MHLSVLIGKNLTYYWRTNLAVAAGCATAVAVLAGALLVGDSVRSSLRTLVAQRLGTTAFVVSTSGNFFREQLAAGLQSAPGFESMFGGACPLIALTGFVTHEPSGRRASGVQVYGVDDRFWQFHGLQNRRGPEGRDVLISPGLAHELEGKAGDVILVRVEKPSAIPLESLHARKEDTGRTIRFSFRETLGASELGEFSIRPQQSAVRAVFVPLRRLQQDLEQRGRANTLLVSQASARARVADLDRDLRLAFKLEDLGLKLRKLSPQNCLSLESEGALIGDSVSKIALSTANSLGLRTMSLFTYLANTIRSGPHQIPYSLVTAADMFPDLSSRQILLNDWAARDLDARPGATVSLDYYVWKGDGRLHTESAQFQLARVVPIRGFAADRDLAPEYPGITESESLEDWDPPFPIDLGRVRPRDDAYWKQYRATPKAFIALKTGQELWSSRFGNLTSIRIFPAAGASLEALAQLYRERLRSALNPTRMGLYTYAAGAEGSTAAAGSTDFGEYFIYFSFFLVVSALLLTGLFFKLGVEQRLHEIGALQAMGYPARKIRTLFLAEGAVLSVLGGLLGMGGALAYAALVMLGLSTWWVGAVGTTLLSLDLNASSLAIGCIGGIVTALVCIAWTLRSLRALSPRELLTGASNDDRRAAPSLKARAVAMLATLFAVVLISAAIAHLVPQSAGFFGAGTLLLTGALAAGWIWLARPGGNVSGVAKLGFRNAGHRPGRSIVCIAFIASAVFIIVAVDAFKREAPASFDRRSGTGGFPLVAESLLPVIHNPNTDSGKDALNISGLPDVSFSLFRSRPGDDASCLNLYQPRNPKILSASDAFIRSGRFDFQNSLARTAEEKRNPWLLLEGPSADGVIPAIADANSMTYTLHRKLGDEFVLDPDSDRPVRLRLVAALADSLFQSELLISEDNFVRLFPDLQGYRFFLIDAPRDKIGEVTGKLEQSLSDYGLDVTPAGARLAEFHRVENTYISTFQALGALGLTLGTFGLAAVLLRNALERRRELALLRAVGYRSRNLAVMAVAENAVLLFSGVVIGTVCALLAIAPAAFTRGGRFPVLSIGLLILATIVSGLATSLLATAAASRSSLLDALRAE